MDLTDNEIIKALECCSDTTMMKCKECPYNISFTECRINQMKKDTIDLINRQKAEIVYLRKLLVEKCDKCNITEEKCEAIKEFAKESINRFSKNYLTQGFYVNTSEIDLINLVKEMVGDTE